MKVMNHTGLWNAKVIWYSSRAYHQIYLYGLENGYKIHSLRPT